jgi:hypothetical protein
MAKAGRPKKENTKVLYIRLPDTIASAVQKKADDERRGLSATIALILEAHFK